MDGWMDGWMDAHSHSHTHSHTHTFTHTFTHTLTHSLTHPPFFSALPAGPRAAAIGGITGLGLAAAFHITKALINREEAPTIGKHEEKQYED